MSFLIQAISGHFALYSKKICPFFVYQTKMFLYFGRQLSQYLKFSALEGLVSSKSVSYKRRVQMLDCDLQLPEDELYNCNSTLSVVVISITCIKYITNNIIISRSMVLETVKNDRTDRNKQYKYQSVSIVIVIIVPGVYIDTSITITNSFLLL